MSRRGILGNARVACGGLAYVGLALLGTAACGRETAPSSGKAAAWSVDALPMLTLGLADSDDLDATFERITGATRLPDGTLLVADVGEAPLKLFDSAGAFVRRVARKGQGPGEMEFLARLFRCGDLIYTYDIDGGRVLQWSLQGESQREFRFQLPALQQAPYASACNGTGRFVHLGWGQLSVPIAGSHRDTVPAWITAAADSAPTVFDSVPSSERWGQTHEGSIVGSLPYPFGKQPHLGIGTDFIAIATGDRSRRDVSPRYRARVRRSRVSQDEEQRQRAHGRLRRTHLDPSSRVIRRAVGAVAGLSPER